MIEHVSRRTHEQSYTTRQIIDMPNIKYDHYLIWHYRYFRYLQINIDGESVGRRVRQLLDQRKTYYVGEKIKLTFGFERKSALERSAINHIIMQRSSCRNSFWSPLARHAKNAAEVFILTAHHHDVYIIPTITWFVVIVATSHVNG